jgi:hypothetical protein
MVDEAERSLHDALSVLSQTVKETRVVLGGGCAEMLMSNAVEEAVRTIKGKKALAVESFSKALRQVRRARFLVRGKRLKVFRCLLFWRITEVTIRQTWSPSCVRPTTKASLTQV